MNLTIIINENTDVARSIDNDKIVGKMNKQSYNRNQLSISSLYKNQN